MVTLAGKTTLLMWLLLLITSFAFATDLEQALNDYEQQRYTEALQTLRGLANQNNSEAQYHLAFMYLNGDGVPSNDRLAVKWFEQAALAGHAGAQDTLAYMYLNGRGLDKDPVQAYAWYSLAADNGIFLASKIVDMLEQQLTLEDRIAGNLLFEDYKTRIKPP